LTRPALRPGKGSESGPCGRVSVWYGPHCIEQKEDLKSGYEGRRSLEKGEKGERITGSPGQRKNLAL